MPHPHPLSIKKISNHTPMQQAARNEEIWKHHQILEKRDSAAMVEKAKSGAVLICAPTGYRNVQGDEKSV